MATLREIGRRAGVSPSVVSRALSPKPDKNARVAPVTRERILALAEELGYRPNRAAEFLRRGSAAAIGAFVNRSHNRLHADLVIGMAEAASDQGFPLDLCFGRSLQRYRRFIEAAPDRPHSGIVTYPYQHAGPATVRVMERFRQEGGKLVLLQPRHEVEGVPSVQVDEAEGGRLVARRLLAQHCDRFCTFGYYWGRIESFAATLREAGASCDRLPGDEAGLRRLKRAAQRGGRLGVFAAADHFALDVYRAFHRSGQRIGREVRVIGYDDMFLMDKVTPALTTVSQPMHRVGALAVRKIVHLIYGKSETSAKLRPELVARESG